MWRVDEKFKSRNYTGGSRGLTATADENLSAGGAQWQHLLQFGAQGLLAGGNDDLQVAADLPGQRVGVGIAEPGGSYNFV